MCVCVCVFCECCVCSCLFIALIHNRVGRHAVSIFFWTQTKKTNVVGMLKCSKQTCPSWRKYTFVGLLNLRSLLPVESTCFTVPTIVLCHSMEYWTMNNLSECSILTKQIYIYIYTVTSENNKYDLFSSSRICDLLQTVFALHIREAAAKTKDSLFTFGAGVDERQCAFKFAFQKLMKDLQVRQVVCTSWNFMSRSCSNMHYIGGIIITPRN